MAESAVTKNRCDGTITFLDGAGTPLEYEVSWEPGDLQINIPGKTVQATQDRGKFTSAPNLRFTGEEPITFSFTGVLRDVHDATDELLASFILDPEGDLSSAVGGWTSTGGANAEVPTRTVRWDIEGTDHGDAADHSITLGFCHVSGSIQEGEETIISIEGTSYQAYPTAMT